MQKLDDNIIYQTYKMIEDYHFKYLKKFNIKMPELKDKTGVKIS